MTNEFLTRLEGLLSTVPESDRKEMLYDYVEHFEMGLTNGKSERDIMEELGDPQFIAKELLADYRITIAEEDHSVSNIFKAIMASISLSFFNLIFVLGPALCIVGVFIGLSVTALALTLSPLFFIGAIFFNGMTDAVMNFFISLLLGSLGGLLSIGMLRVGKFLYQLFLQYIKFNLKIIKGDKKI